MSPGAARDSRRTSSLLVLNSIRRAPEEPEYAELVRVMARILMSPFQVSNELWGGKERHHSTLIGVGEATCPEVTTEVISHFLADEKFLSYQMN